MAYKLVVILSLIAMTYAQRAGYAGSRPVGYPTVVNDEPAAANGIENKYVNKKFFLCILSKKMLSFLVLSILFCICLSPSK